MEYSITKDKRLRLKFIKKEQKFLECKSLYNNRFLSPESRELARYQLVNLETSPVKIMNRCIVTGRSGGVLRPFKVTRLEFKRSVAKGHYLGVKKGSW